MSTRLDLVLQKHPEHEEGIRLLAARDPSRNLKYLDWGVKMLASGQALAPEIADVIDLFHQFNGRHFGRRHGRRRGQCVHPDIYTYRPQDLASLRDNLRKIERATDRKRRERERLYRIEGTIEADVIYDSEDLVVRHIKNKEACCHYGLNTKWCIAMRRERYFDDYETQNAVFFFFERKSPVGDAFDKVALMVPRSGEDDDGYDDGFAAFTALDIRVDMLALAKAYGPRVFDIFRVIYECSERHPASAMFRLYAGTASAEELGAVFANVVKGSFAPNGPLEAICCNDAAPYSLLEELARRATALVGAWARRRRSHGRTRPHRRGHDATKELLRAVMAAMVIHPNVPADVRETLTKQLRRRRIYAENIHRATHRGRVAIEYERGGGSRRWKRRVRRYHRNRSSVRALRARAAMFARAAIRARKRARALQRKLTEAKKNRRARAALRAKRKRRA